jgi:predicted dehydrogenase
MQVETLAVTYAQTASGVRVVMNTGDEVEVNRQGKKTLFRLVGTDGVIEFWGWESAYHIRNRENPDGRLVQVPPTPEAVNRHQVHLERLADEVAAGTPSYVVAGSSLTALELCDAAYLSHRHRCTVNFPLRDFVPPPPVEWSPGSPYSGQGGGRDGRKFG